MIRKIALLGTTFALLALSSVAFAAGDPLVRGCYVEASVAGTPVTSVNEGVDFLATVKCTLIPDDVFGFEFGTTFASANNFATAPATTYTPGTFVTTAAGGLFNVGANLRSTVYAVTRQGTDTATGTFTLGSFDVTVPFGLTGGDSSATIDLPSGTFKLSDNSGGSITAGNLQAVPGAIITITDLTVALLDGTIIVQSDGTMTNIKNISLTLGTPDVGTSPTTVLTQAGSSQSFPVSGLQYTTDLSVDVAVTMTGHLSCSVTDTLLDGPNAAATAMGTITLYAGDATTVSDHAIDNLDAIAIGGAFGTSSTSQVDVNGDGLVDIYDLVQVGRNFGQTSAVCPSTGFNS